MSPPQPRAALRGLLLVVVLGGVLRAAVAALVFPVTPLGDELYYTETAVRIARGEGHVFGPHRLRASWPPGPAALLAPFADTGLAREHPEILQELSRLQPAEMEARHRRFLAPLVAVAVVVGSLTVGAVAWLAHGLFGPRVAVIAAALAAVHPALVATSHTFWSENAFAALLTAALAATVACWRRPRAATALAAGVVFGLAGLTREIALPTALAAAAWLGLAAPRGPRRSAALHAALLVLATAATVAPWSLRNAEQLGRFVPVSTAGWMGLREGNTLAEDAFFERDWEAVRAFRARYVAIPDEGRRIDVARSEAIERVREAQPAWLLRKLAINLGELASPDAEVFFKILQGAYGGVPHALARALLVTHVAFTLLLLAAAALGAAGAPDRARRLLPLFALAPLLVVHVLANAFAKYRLPLEPLLVCYAAYAVTRTPQASWRAASRRGVALAIVTVALVVLLGAPRFLPRAAKLWREGAPAVAPETASPEPAAGGADRPARILLLSMDTVRADHVSGYGADAATPAIARLAAEGARVRRAYAASNYTIPSHMSLFTGLDPVEHGVTREAARLSPEVPTLAELLREAGYRTRGFHEGAYVEPRFGFARGFEVYRRYPRVEVVRRALPGVLDWIREHREERWFLFLHTYAAHFPYGGYERVRAEHPERRLPSDAEIAELRQRHPGSAPMSREQARGIPAETRYACTLYNQLAESHGRLLPCGDYLFGEEFRASHHYAEDHAAVLRAYAARVRLVDDALARIRETLEQLSQWEDTLVVVTADHGEAFYEHGLVRHDFVPFQEVTRVPLVLGWPRFFAGRAGRVLDGPAWHLDLLPTLAALVGFEAPPGLRGRDLSPALRGEAEPSPARPVFPAILRAAHRPQIPLRRVIVRGDVERIEGHEAFGDAEGFLFDLAADPNERRNLREVRPDVVSELDALAERYAAQLAPTRPVHQHTGLPLDAEGEAPLELTPEQAEELRQLGYLETE